MRVLSPAEQSLIEEFAAWVTDQYEVAELDWSNRYKDGPDRRALDADEIVTTWQRASA